MIAYLLNGEIQIFCIVLAALVFSMTLHQFFWALAATWMGDDTPIRAGRLSLDPLVHIDPFGLLMVIAVGFGYFKPVPTDSDKFSHHWSQAFIAAFSLLAFVLVAVCSVNGYIWLTREAVIATDSPAAVSLIVLAQLNLLLAVFNLLPIGQLNGHHILAWLLPSWLSRPYVELNARYGIYLLLGLVALSFIGVPVFKSLMDFSANLVPFLRLVSP